MKLFRPVLIFASVLAVSVYGQDSSSPEQQRPVGPEQRLPEDDGQQQPQLAQPPPPFSHPPGGNPARQRPPQAGFGNLLSGERERGKERRTLHEDYKNIWLSEKQL
jgi:hypothetical protein